MNKIKQIFNIKNIAIFLIIIFVYRYWFIEKEIIGGDWLYFFNETLLQRFSHIPTLWSSIYGNGLGGEILTYPLDFFLYLLVSVFVNTLHFSWIFTYKIFLFGFFLVSSIFSSFYLFRVIFPKINNLWLPAIASLIFTTNTYILMIASGGQIGVAIVYSLSPLILARFIKMINDKLSLRNSVIAGLVLALQIFFDPRFAYISLIAVFSYYIFHFIFTKKINKKLLFYLIFSFFVSLFLNAFWILKILVSHSFASYQILENLGSVGIFKFFSFGTFSQTISLLHPNWPDNIFGKVYFMKPEFILLPILAFLSLMFVDKKSEAKKEIIFFSFLALLGAFLAKGAVDPLGVANSWIYTHIPGFIVFRDPTKFYVLTAISYSVLIPYSIWQIQKKFFQNNFIPILIFLLFWLFLINPAITGKLGGTFKSYEVSRGYIDFKNFIYNQKDFFRTLWIPRQDRFTFYSNIHPSVEAGPLFNALNLSDTVKDLQNPQSEKFISDLGIKYIVIPDDSLGEIFLNDRKYDDSLYRKTVNEVGKISWLKEVNGFGKVRVFETKSHKDHFWSPSTELRISYNSISPSEYKVEVQNAKKGDLLVFSEGFNKNWIAKSLASKGEILQGYSSEFNTLNSFLLPERGNYELKIYYTPQKWVNIGFIVSLISLFSALSYLIFGYKSKK